MSIGLELAAEARARDAWEGPALQALVAEQHRRDVAFVTIIDRDGTVLAHSNARLIRRWDGGGAKITTVARTKSQGGRAVMCKVVGLGIGVAIVGVVLGSTWSQAQQMPTTGAQMQHEQMMGHGAMQRIPTLPGQDAFGAIQEVVRILEADPTTDWSKVDLERLRQHLIDMNDVTLRSEVKATAVPGGLTLEVTGTGRTEQAIRRMVGPHTVELNSMSQWSARTEEIPGGLRLTVVVKNPDDAKTVARIRGLGFIGLLVQGGHHQPHHLAMAKGEDLAGHGH